MPFEVTKLGDKPTGKFEVTNLGTGQPAAQPDGEEESEGWLSYLGRNFIAKAPTYAYEAGRTGLGIGNLLQPLTRALLPESAKTLKGNITPPKGALWGQSAEPVDMTRLLPFVSNATARQEASSVLPNVMTEQRQGDWFPEFIGSQAIPLALNAPKSLADVMQTLAMYGGGHLASQGMGTIAPSITKNEDLQEFLEQSAGFAGGHYAGKGARTLMEKSTGRLAPRVEEKAREEYQTQKSEYENAEAQRVGEEQAKMAEIYGPAVTLAFEEEGQAKAQLPKEQEAFRQDKNKRVIEAKNEIANYDENIKAKQAQQKAAYSASEQVRNGGAIGDAEPIMDAANNAVKVSGLDSSDKASVHTAAKEVEDAMVNGTLTLDKAIELQKNFNGQLYPQPSYSEKPNIVSNNFRRAMRPMIESLNKFIENIGGEEHFAPWSQGEELTRTISDLSQNKKKFVKSKTDQIKSINQEKFSETRQNHLENQAREATKKRENLEREYKLARNQIGPVTWEKLMRDESVQHKLEQNFIDAAVKGPKGVVDAPIKAGLGAVGAVLGYLKLGIIGGGLGTLGGFIGKTAYNQVSYARRAFKKYPSVKNETYKLIKDATRLTPQRLALRLSALGSKMERISESTKDEAEE